MGVFGGIAFTIYPVSVARSHDLFEPKDVVAVSTALLLAYGIGASIGPIAASGFMTVAKSPYGFFAYCALIGAMYAVAGYGFRRKEKIRIVSIDAQVRFAPMQSASPVAGVMDSRSDIDKR